MSGRLEDQNTDELIRDKRIGEYIEWISFIIAIINLGILEYRNGLSMFLTSESNVIPMVCIPFLVGILFLIGVR